MLLYMKIPQIEPSLDDFRTLQIEMRRSSTFYTEQQRRIPNNPHCTFVHSNLEDKKRHLLGTYAKELEKQNSLDLLLYKRTIKSVCDFLHVSGIWSKYEVIRDYWKAKQQLWSYGDIMRDAAYKCSRSL
jgi:hypothetical protein